MFWGIVIGMFIGCNVALILYAMLSASKSN